MSAALYFELDKNELAQTMSIIDEFSEAINHGLDYEHDNQTLADFRNRLSAIRDKARERNLKYYASHHEELITALQGAIRDIVCFAVLVGKEGIHYTPDDWTYKFGELSPYLALLNEPERAKIFEYMNYAYDHREQIFKDEEEKNTQTYESAKAKRVKKIISPVDKVTQSIFNPSKNAPLYREGGDLIVGRNKKNDVTTAVSLRIENLGEVKTSTMLTEFHRTVFNAAISQILTGNTLFSDSMIARTITGKENAEGNIIHLISEVMDTLIRTRASIDATQEAKAFGLKGLENVKYEGALLDVRRITATINGQTLECYKIIAEPWLLTYAKAKNQLDTYDVRRLNAPFQAISATQENISLVSNLLNHIVAMLNPNSRIGNIILYETLYQLAGIDAPTEATAETKRRRLRNTIHKILDVWTNEGLIDGYEDLDEDGKPAKNGKKIAKIKISCSVKKRRLSAKRK